MIVAEQEIAHCPGCGRLTDRITTTAGYDPVTGNPRTVVKRRCPTRRTALGRLWTDIFFWRTFHIDREVVGHRGIR